MSAGGFFGQTVETVRRRLTERFRAHAVDSPELDARILVGAELGLDLTGVIAAAARPLTAAEAELLRTTCALLRCPLPPLLT